MSVVINEQYLKKAEDLKKPLKERTVLPKNTVSISEDKDCFQGLRVIPSGDIEEYFTLNANDEIILDFGEHCVGYLSFHLDHYGDIKICDAPVRLRFFFGEFPLEIKIPPEEYKGGLGSGWLQNEERSYVFLPCKGHPERRYSFRYLKIRRTDTASFPVKISDIKVKALSSADKNNISPFDFKDEILNRIYKMSLTTLSECEQEVFEDGPKRDRRLWIGDLKLQAMTDYVTYKNTDLIKRCIYLFAGAYGEHEMVAPCIFPDSPPYVDEWTFCDYSLYFISCLYDWYKNTGDSSLVKELFDIAQAQALRVSEKLNMESGVIELRPFIDWCPGLDKNTALLGVYIYTLRQLKELEMLLNKPYDSTDSKIAQAEKLLLKYFDKDKGSFLSPSGQISHHSQVWAVLSGILTEDEARRVLCGIKDIDTEFTMRTPYMMHYYIEAMYRSGMKKEALEFIRDYWGQIAAAGFDCCPEVFNPKNQFESPYGAPEINSACHAWSCTPAYWIPKLI